MPYIAMVQRKNMENPAHAKCMWCFISQIKQPCQSSWHVLYIPIIPVFHQRSYVRELKLKTHCLKSSTHKSLISHVTTCMWCMDLFQLLIHSCVLHPRCHHRKEEAGYDWADVESSPGDGMSQEYLSPPPVHHSHNLTRQDFRAHTVCG